MEKNVIISPEIERECVNPFQGAVSVSHERGLHFL